MNRRTLESEKLLSSSPSQKSALRKKSRKSLAKFPAKSPCKKSKTFTDVLLQACRENLLATENSRCPVKTPHKGMPLLQPIPRPTSRVAQAYAPSIERGEKTPTPKISALLRKRPVLLRTNFVLTKDRKRPYYGHFCGKIHREGSCSEAAGRP